VGRVFKSIGTAVKKVMKSPIFKAIIIAVAIYFTAGMVMSAFPALGGTIAASTTTVATMGTQVATTGAITASTGAALAAPVATTAATAAANAITVVATKLPAAAGLSAGQAAFAAGAAGLASGAMSSAAANPPPNPNTPRSDANPNSKTPDTNYLDRIVDIPTDTIAQAPISQAQFVNTPTQISGVGGGVGQGSGAAKPWYQQAWDGYNNLSTPMQNLVGQGVMGAARGVGSYFTSRSQMEAMQEGDEQRRLERARYSAVPDVTRFYNQPNYLTQPTPPGG